MAKFRKPFDPKVLDATPRDDGGPVAGMMLRDWLAGKAASGLAVGDTLMARNLAELAYKIADAMIAQRAK